MTVQAPIHPRVDLDRLVRCDSAQLGTPAWWACVTRSLDLLRGELSGADIPGLAAQVRWDAPHCAAAADRLESLASSVAAECLTIWRMACKHRGDNTAAPAVRHAVELLLRRVRSLHRASDDLLLNAYELDLGGD